MTKLWEVERSSSSLEASGASRIYEQNLQYMRKIAFLTNLTIISNWFLSFCALTWASTALLGGYIQELSISDYYDVTLLLFVEGLRFGIVGYRLSDFYKKALHSLEFSLSLGMGGFAVLSILPRHIRHNFHLWFLGRKFSHASVPDPRAPTPLHSDPSNLAPSLNIFYILILSNAFVLLIGSAITSLMRQRFGRSSGVKSLWKYHDKMVDSSTGWLDPTINLSFAYQIQASQYRIGKDANHVCEHYADLICFLYLHDKGVEAAEAALLAEDAYVREAAANIIGFWAVLETLEDVQELRVPLCFQKGMLSKLADIAAENYNSLGTAAAWSFGLLIDLVHLESIGMVASVRSKSTGQDLIDILLIRAAELLYPPCPLYRVPKILQKESKAHIYALCRYLLRLQSASESSTAVPPILFEAQQAQLVGKIKASLPLFVKDVSHESLIQRLEEKLSHLLGPVDHNKCHSDIKEWLTASPPRPSWASPIKASFLLLFNVAVPLACLGVGFMVNSLLFKYP